MWPCCVCYPLSLTGPEHKTQFLERVAEQTHRFPPVGCSRSWHFGAGAERVGEGNPGLSLLGSLPLPFPGSPGLVGLLGIARI